MSNNTLARPTDQALVSDQAASRLAPSGFDPSRMTDTDWHVMAQDVANWWTAPSDRAVAYQAAAEAIKPLRLILEAWDRNETLNCINWGPCSRNDSRMCDSDGSPKGGDGEAGSVHDSADPKGIASTQSESHS